MKVGSGRWIVARILCGSWVGAGCQNKQTRPGQGGGSGSVVCTFRKAFLKKGLSSFEEIWLYRVRTGAHVAQRCDQDDAEGQPASLNTSHAPLPAPPPASRPARHQGGSSPARSFGYPLVDLLSVIFSTSVLKSRFAFRVRNTDFGVHFTAPSS